MEEKNDYRLYIPVNIKTRTEFFNGFGTSELIVSLLTAVVTTIICVILHLYGAIGIGTAVVSVMLSVATVITFTVKSSSNISVIDYARFLIEFLKLQKKYKYVYKEDLLS